MRIIQASSYFYPHIGGVETHVFELAQSLQSIGHEVIVLCAAVPKSDPEEVLHGLHIYRFPALDLPYVPFIYALQRRIAQFSADVIHSHYPPPFISYGAVKGLPQVPHVLTYHCDLEIPDHIANLRIPSVLRHAVKRVNNRLYAKPALDAVNQIIATTQSYAESSPLLQNYQYEIVPNGVSLQAFDSLHTSREREIKQVLFVGRLSSVKGVEYLIKAAKIVLTRHEDATFLIVGDGEERQSLKALTKGYENCIKFCGHISKRALVELYKSSAVLVLPSYTRLEAFGVVLLEAMACETPVIASRIPGVCDVIGKGGFLVTPRSSQALAAAIQNVFDSPANARRMGKRGRQLVEQKYDWKIVAQKVLDVYSKVQD
ncbi:MAG: glycosyltransferase family 4 protein [Halobacteriota archaeon]